jgi:hypothetical protein
LYNILLEFGIPMKPIRRIKIYLYETFRKVRIGQHMTETVSIKNGPKQRNNSQNYWVFWTLSIIWYSRN